MESTSSGIVWCEMSFLLFLVGMPGLLSRYYRFISVSAATLGVIYTCT
jgi:hypothetical protein